MIMKKEEMKITELYDLTHTLASDYLKQFTYPWEALAGLSDFIIELGNSLDPAEYEKRGENIWVHKTAKVFDSAYLHGPVIVGKDAEVRHCAFVRGSALIGESAVVGNSTELKNVILFDKVQVPHYNYVGDSILGYKSHMGAGSITSTTYEAKADAKINTFTYSLQIFPHFFSNFFFGTAVEESFCRLHPQKMKNTSVKMFQNVRFVSESGCKGKDFFITSKLFKRNF